MGDSKRMENRIAKILEIKFCLPEHKIIFTDNKIVKETIYYQNNCKPMHLNDNYLM